MRIFRLIAAPVILLGLLGVLIWGANWGWKELTRPLPTPPPTPCVVEEADLVNPTMVTLRVLNGGFISGQARRVRDHLTDIGFDVVQIDNTEEQIRQTIIRGNPKDQAQIRLAASQFLDATVEHDERVDGIVDVLIGTQFQGYNPEPYYQVSAVDGQICRPPQPEVSPTPTPTPSPVP